MKFAKKGSFFQQPVRTILAFALSLGAIFGVGQSAFAEQQPSNALTPTSPTTALVEKNVQPFPTTDGAAALGGTIQRTTTPSDLLPEEMQQTQENPAAITQITMSRLGDLAVAAESGNTFKVTGRQQTVTTTTIPDTSFAINPQNTGVSIGVKIPIVGKQPVITTVEQSGPSIVSKKVTGYVLNRSWQNMSLHEEQSRKEKVAVVSAPTPAAPLPPSTLTNQKILAATKPVSAPQIGGSQTPKTATQPVQPLKKVAPVQPYVSNKPSIFKQLSSAVQMCITWGGGNRSCVTEKGTRKDNLLYDQSTKEASASAPSVITKASVSPQASAPLVQQVQVNQAKTQAAKVSVSKNAPLPSNVAASFFPVTKSFSETIAKSAGWAGIPLSPEQTTFLENTLKNKPVTGIAFAKGENNKVIAYVRGVSGDFSQVVIPSAQTVQDHCSTLRQCVTLIQRYKFLEQLQTPDFAETRAEIANAALHALTHTQNPNLEDVEKIRDFLSKEMFDTQNPHITVGMVTLANGVLGNRGI